MDKFFKISAKGSTAKREVLAGITTFLAMAYILFVNPSMLSQTGMDQGAVFVATALSAAIGTLIMGLFANFPIAQAPGMGLNAFFTFGVVFGMGYSWEQALAAIFIAGLIFILLSVTGARKAIINAIPVSLKYAIGTGIGFFIAFIGLKGAGIVAFDTPAGVIDGQAVVFDVIPVLGNLSGNTLLAIVGFIITIVLYVRNVKGSIFIGMAATSVIGMIFGLVSLPTQIVGTIPSIAPTFGKVFGALASGELYTLSFFTVIFSFLFVDFFDTAGTIIAVGDRAGLLNEEGELVDADKALLADSTATVIGSILGTSNVTSYIESLSGVEEGGRTGLTSVVTSICFVLALFFSPLLGVVTSAVTAPALIMVGALMINSFGKIEWDDITVTITSFLIIITMTLTYSIANGIAIGFIIYVILMAATNRAKEVNPIMWVLMLFFLAYFII